MISKTVAIDYSRLQARLKILAAALLSIAVVAFGAPKAQAQSAGGAMATMDFIAFMAPVQGVDINSRFGLRRLSFEPRARMHEGVDYAARSGSPILAAAAGRVLRTGTSSTYGRFVEIEHSNGVTSFYAHMSRVGATQGQIVQAGQEIGKVGTSGRVTGAHLHFEIRRDGQQINPERFLGKSFEVASVIPQPRSALSMLASSRSMPDAPIPYAVVAGLVSTVSSAASSAASSVADAISPAAGATN